MISCAVGLRFTTTTYQHNAARISQPTIILTFEPIQIQTCLENGEIM
jgi:hypothetical protein